MSAALIALPGRQDAARRLVESRLRDALREVETAERHLNAVVLGLVAGASELSVVNSRSQAAIREARERAFAARRDLDEARMGLLVPDADALTPNDEEDLATALSSCLAANEAARIDSGDFDRLTPACVGVTTRW
jgi:hypothetical protein